VIALPKLTPITGLKLVKILCNQFGFKLLRQKGSHVTLNKDNLYVTVPAHLIGVGLLSTILRDCGIPRDEFLKYA
jgi:predicted RNA binding protein YcfA (HicA-like mRNA interferase family)